MAFTLVGPVAIAAKKPGQASAPRDTDMVTDAAIMAITVRLVTMVLRTGPAASTITVVAASV
jgi:hypothetical protein